MKAIKIDIKNAATIEAALAAVNGRAEAHTYTTFYEVADVAAKAEAALENLLLKGDRPGARWSKTSGSKVANSYKNSRLATTVVLERKTAGWYLVEVHSVSVMESGGGKGRLTLTQAQDAAAKALLQKQYRVA